MSNQFLAEIRIFPFNFAPTGWASCNGQLLPISQYTALFSLLGTNYGGDGKSNFALPNLQGCVPMHYGQGSGLFYDLGQSGGSATVTLLTTQIPSHSHYLNVTSAAGTAGDPTGLLYANGNWTDGSGNTGAVQYYTATAPNVSLAPGALSATGGNAAHNNLMPYLTLNFCVALTGVFPPRS